MGGTKGQGLLGGRGAGMSPRQLWREPGTAAGPRRALSPRADRKGWGWDGRESCPSDWTEPPVAPWLANLHQGADSPPLYEGMGALPWSPAYFSWLPAGHSQKFLFSSPLCWLVLRQGWANTLHTLCLSIQKYWVNSPFPEPTSVSSHTCSMDCSQEWGGAGRESEVSVREQNHTRGSPDGCLSDWPCMQISQGACPQGLPGPVLLCRAEVGQEICISHRLPGVQVLRLPIVPFQSSQLSMKPGWWGWQGKENKYSHKLLSARLWAEGIMWIISLILTQPCELAPLFCIFNRWD